MMSTKFCAPCLPVSLGAHRGEVHESHTGDPASTLKGWPPKSSSRVSLQSTRLIDPYRAGEGKLCPVEGFWAWLKRRWKKICFFLEKRFL